MENANVCIPNINSAERRKRLFFGAISLGAALIVLTVLISFSLDRWWRILLLPFFAAAATGYFQWHDKTCVALSAKNTRKIGDFEEKIVDPLELSSVKRQARMVQLKSLLTAVPVTLVMLVLPVHF